MVMLGRIALPFPTVVITNPAVLTLLVLLTLCVKVVAMKPGALKPTAVETASGMASAVVASTLSQEAGTSVEIGRNF